MSTAQTLLDSLTHPVVLAPMAGSGDGRLAAAVTRAGGLGTISFGYAATPEVVDRQTAVAREAGPFGIGLMTWQVAGQRDTLRTVVESGPALLTLSFGDPHTVVPDVRELAPDLPLATQVGTLAEAETALEAGIDVLVARGSEGGGHGRGEVASLPLLQQVLAMAGDVPVLAAGGIATGRGVAAALAAGAAGVWVGTVFAACTDSPVKPSVRSALLAADASETVYTRAFDTVLRLAWPRVYGGRALSNAFARDWSDRIPELEQALEESGELTEQVTAARAVGDPDLAPVYAGQSVGLVDAERSAAEVMAELATFREHLAAAARRWTG